MSKFLGHPIFFAFFFIRTDFVSVPPYICTVFNAKSMEQNREQQSFSEQLTQRIMSESFDIAEMFGKAAQSYPQNQRKQRIHIAIAAATGFVIGALSIYFFAS